MALRRVVRYEQAGIGMRMIREEWKKPGYPASIYTNDRTWNAFRFFIHELDREVDITQRATGQRKTQGIRRV